ncbi:MAG: hypothetical protein U0792_15570 [Gemmataceae bacterium]
MARVNGCLKSFTAAVGVVQAAENGDERGFASAIGAEQPEEFADLDGQRHAAERDEFAVPLPHIPDFENGFGHPDMIRTRACAPLTTHEIFIAIAVGNP